MKKKLLSLAFVAALLPALNASGASDPGLTQMWKTPFLEIGDWDGNAASWSTPETVKATPCARFATARDGKVYTVNMVTMSIAEVTDEGLKDIISLPFLASEPMVKLANGTEVPQIYGSAISLDEAGNYLIGRNFVTPTSSLYWSVCSNGKTVNLPALPVPEGWTIGRIDCVGHVLGDLTREALFFIAPTTGCTNEVRVIKATGNGSVESIELEEIGTVKVPASYAGQQGIVQPAFATYAEYAAAGEENYNFYYSGCSGVNTAYASYINGKVTTNFAPDMAYSINSGVNGFDTFVLGGKRYFVRNYSTKADAREMGFAVLNEKGDILSTYMNTDYVPNGGSSTLVAEPLADNTANIYIYNSNGKGVQAAQVKFDPSQCGEPIVPEVPVGATPDDAYRISTPEDFMNISSKATGAEFYAVLENDIDFAGYMYTPINTKSNIHLDGQNHVVKNVYTFDPKWDNWGLFKAVKGEFKNLGIVNTYNYVASGCAGALMGEASGDVTIDNCYATGYVFAAAGGGLVGTVCAGTTTITNSYSLVNVTGPASAYLGGLVGRVGSYNGNPGKLEVSYCYNGGNVTGGATVGGIAAVNVATSEVKVDNVISWGSLLSGTTVDAFCAGIDFDLGDNYWIYDGLLINDVPDGDASQETLMGVIAGWDAFNKTVSDGRAVLAWQTANGSKEIPARIGTEANPYAIRTAQDLAAIRNILFAGDNYLTVENDIDMTDVPYVAPLGNNNFSGVVVHLDGKQHVISNLKVEKGDYPSLIGVFMGEIKNLGLADVEITGGGVGPFGGFVGHASYDGVTTIDNCFATGKATGSSYAGGIGGYTNGNTNITNSYTRVQLAGGLYAGGVIAWVPGGETVIKNVYAAGYVEATGEAGRAAGVANFMTGVKSATLSDVVAWAPGVSAVVPENAAVINGGDATATEANVVFSEELVLNGETTVEGGKAETELQALVSSWEAFSDKLDKGFPMLKWQAEGSAGINDIVVDETEATGPAVYYNLQGVEVANPENGIYIVRRGNKVTKEIVR